jgi:hypothetical protein
VLTAAAVDARAVQYQAAFEAERANAYPAIDALEQRYGYALDRDRLEGAARVLACPLKANPPNWQHGRLLYAVSRWYFAEHEGLMNVLDIGTAKGFSALCLLWAMRDAGRMGVVTSVDVIDPFSREPRNSVGDIAGRLTLFELLAPWPESRHIAFHRSTGVDALTRDAGRVHVAFVDGKHTGAVVHREGELLAQHQNAGDVSIFDDIHIPGIEMAVRSLEPFYAFERVEAKPGRAYAIGVRK